jgi:hypothetical protein
MKKIRLLTSVEDTVLCKLKYGMDISSNTLCAIKGKKKLAPTPHTQSNNLWQRAKGWVSIYSQGRVFDPGSWHELGPMLRREPHAMLGGALVPIYATNQDRFSELNRDWPPYAINRDQCLSLVSIDKPNRDRCDFGARPKTHFLLVIWHRMW